MNHLDNAKSALEYANGFPVRDAKDMALVAIANALVAIAEGRGMCRIEERYGGWYCMNCGEMIGTFDPTSELHIEWNAVELWDYCPRCGAKVVER